MRTATVVLIVAFLLLASLGTALDWQQGQGWGYKWEVNAYEIYANNTFNGTAEGKSVLGLYVEYNGEENGLYNFSYIGSFYSYIFLNGTMRVNILPSTTISWNNTRTWEWINSRGYFLLERCNVTDDLGMKHEVYAIKEQYIHVYTKEPMKIYMNTKIESQGHIVYSTTNITLSFDIKLKLHYEQPAAYIPLREENFSYSTNISYTGHIKLKAKGYYSEGNCTTLLNTTIDKEVSDSINPIIHFTSSGKMVNRTGVIENVPVGFSNINPFIFQKGVDFYLSLAIRMISQPAKAHLGDQFYTSITLAPYILGMNGATSQNATREDVENIMTKAPQIYGPSTQQGYPIDIIIGIVVAVVILAVIIIVGEEIKRKNQRGTT